MFFGVNRPMSLTFSAFVALSIRAEIMQWVYASGSAVKPRKRIQTAAQQQTRKAISSGFFSSLFSSFSSPQRGVSPNPEQPVEEHDDKEQEAEERRKLLKVTETSVVLAVFSASVDVRLDANLREELLRATKKNSPTHMRYELIYVRETLIIHLLMLRSIPRPEKTSTRLVGKKSKDLKLRVAYFKVCEQT